MTFLYRTHVKSEYVPPLFLDPFVKDVTTAYLKTKDIVVERDFETSITFVSLTCAYSITYGGSPQLSGGGMGIRWSLRAWAQGLFICLLCFPVR